MKTGDYVLSVGRVSLDTGRPTVAVDVWDHHHVDFFHDFECALRKVVSFRSKARVWWMTETGDLELLSRAEA